MCVLLLPHFSTLNIPILSFPVCLEFFLSHSSMLCVRISLMFFSILSVFLCCYPSPVLSHSPQSPWWRLLLSKQQEHVVYEWYSLLLSVVWTFPLQVCLERDNIRRRKRRGKREAPGVVDKVLGHSDPISLLFLMPFSLTPLFTFLYFPSLLPLIFFVIIFCISSLPLFTISLS